MKFLYGLAVALCLSVEAIIVVDLASTQSVRFTMVLATFFALCDVVMLIGALQLRQLAREAEASKPKPCRKCQFLTPLRDADGEPLCLFCQQPIRRAV